VASARGGVACHARQFGSLERDQGPLVSRARVDDQLIGFVQRALDLGHRARTVLPEQNLREHAELFDLAQQQQQSLALW